MGESIAEGTVVRWIKKVGDEVERDEPLFEISTDKVDAEIPSPAAGVLTEILAKEGETVPVNSVVAVIGGGGRGCRAERRGASAAGAGGRPAPDATPRPSQRHTAGRRAAATARTRPRRRQPRTERRTTCAARSRRRSCAGSPRSTTSTSSRSRAPASAAASPSRTSSTTSKSGGASRRRRQRAAERQAARRPRGTRARVTSRARRVSIVPMSVMRKKIAEHMVLSAHTSPHVYSVYEVNFARVTALREKHKARVRGGRREAHVHGVHRQGRSSTRCASSRSSTPRSTATTSSTRKTSTSGSPWRSTTA